MIAQPKQEIQNFWDFDSLDRPFNCASQCLSTVV